MTCEIRVELESATIDAGEELRLTCKVASSPAIDLRGRCLHILDQDGALVARPELREFDGEANETTAFQVEAPLMPGPHTWKAVCPALAEAGFTDQETSSPFGFAVRPHRRSVVVWDVPPTVESGERFRVKLGIKCHSGCRPDAWTVEVHDEEGERRGLATVTGPIWPGSEGLYHTNVDLSAPDGEGVHTWEIRVPVHDLDRSHAECMAPFRVRVVPAPDCVLTVAATDGDTNGPLEGARVFAHPYEAFTDARGVAQVRLPRGDYRLFVSGKKHSPIRRDLRLTEDLRIEVELVLDRELSDADIWF